MDIDTEDTPLIVGEGNQLLHLSNNNEFQAMVDCLSRQARRHIKIFSQTLDHEIYNRSDYTAIITRLCRHAPKLKVFIIVGDMRALVKRGHQLIELQKRLPSIITTLELADDFDDVTDEYLIVDDIAFVQRLPDGPLFGRSALNARALSSKLSRQFDDIKKHCSPNIELRRLNL